MGMLANRAVVGKPCHITFTKENLALPVKGVISGVTQELVTITVHDANRLRVFSSGAEDIVYRSTDKDERDYGATGISLLYSRKNNRIVAISGDTKTSYQNNRMFPRYDYPVDMLVCKPRETSMSTCQGLNISQRGAAFKSAKQFSAETELELEIYNRYKNKTFTVKAVVKYSRRSEDGRFIVGCFIAENENLTDLVDEITEEVLSKAMY